MATADVELVFKREPVIRSFEREEITTFERIEVTPFQREEITRVYVREDQK
jgi:hypothetical protein